MIEGSIYEVRCKFAIVSFEKSDYDADIYDFSQMSSRSLIVIRQLRKKLMGKESIDLLLDPIIYGLEDGSFKWF